MLMIKIAFLNVFFSPTSLYFTSSSGSKLQLKHKEKIAVRQNILYICYTAQINTQSAQTDFSSGQIENDCLNSSRFFFP